MRGVGADVPDIKDSGSKVLMKASCEKSQVEVWRVFSSAPAAGPAKWAFFRKALGVNHKSVRDPRDPARRRPAAPP